MKRQSTNNGSNSVLIPFDIISAASQGDADAIKKILTHYRGYILTLSTRRLYDASGMPSQCIDHELRNRLEAKLMSKILTFNIA